MDNLKNYIESISVKNLRRKRSTESEIKNLALRIKEYEIKLEDASFHDDWATSSMKYFLFLHFVYKTTQKETLFDRLCPGDNNKFEVISVLSNKNVKIHLQNNVVFEEFFFISPDNQIEGNLVVGICENQIDASTLFDEFKINEAQDRLYDFADYLSTIIMQCKSTLSSHEMSEFMNHLISSEGFTYGLGAMENTRLNQSINAVKNVEVNAFAF